MTEAKKEEKIVIMLNGNFKEQTYIASTLHILNTCQNNKLQSFRAASLHKLFLHAKIIFIML